LDVPITDTGSALKHGASATDVSHRKVLEALHGAGNVSQRRLGEAVGMAASRVNRIIRRLLAAGHVEVVDHGVRPFAYRLTPMGNEYFQELSYDHYAAVVGRFRQVQERIRSRLLVIRRGGVKRVVFYGAGEVMEVAYPLAAHVGLEVVGVVDDDPGKQGLGRVPVSIGAPESIVDLAPDAVVITTFRHAGLILRRAASVRAGMNVVQL
jgi:DNA-binding MarR family transcriptional regulator